MFLLWTSKLCALQLLLQSERRRRRQEERVGGGETETGGGEAEEGETGRGETGGGETGGREAEEELEGGEVEGKSKTETGILRHLTLETPKQGSRLELQLEDMAWTLTKASVSLILHICVLQWGQDGDFCVSSFAYSCDVQGDIDKFSPCLC